MRVPSWVRDHSLSIVFAALFLGALVGQALAGVALENDELSQHGQPPVTLLEYVTSSSFVVDVAENWQSEFLQFFLFILGTVWLVQRGSPESKRPGDEGTQSDEQQLVGEHARPDSPAWSRANGWRRWVYANSLLLVMGAIFLASWLMQSLAGVVVYNEQQVWHAQPETSWGAYLLTPDFWSRTLQNWQSELLAVGCMAAFAIYLRQRGSSESKPVGMPHDTSAIESE